MNIDDFLPYMRDVVRCEASLRELNLMWRVIESMAEMNCGPDADGLLPMIAATRHGFERLECVSAWTTSWPRSAPRHAT